MKQFLKSSDIGDLGQAINEALLLKNDPFAYQHLGQHKTLGLLFFNSSLRTRLSTEKAAKNLGMHVMVLNVNSDSWQLEFNDGVVMDGSKSEHIREAAQVLSQYCDIIGVRAFPGLQNKSVDESEIVLSAFKKYASVPILNLESSMAHPLQGFTDAITINELTQSCKEEGRLPNVVLSWAPHPKALPHAVANSFISTLQNAAVNLKVANPQGYDLNPEILGGVPVYHSQAQAFKNADIIYVKNWSSYTNYGEVLHQDSDWMITNAHLKNTNTAKVLHCLPVRRNVVIADEVLDSAASAVIQQAGNRTWAAQYVLKKMLENGN